MTPALLLAWAMADRPRLLDVRGERLEGRPAVVAVAAGPLGDVGVRREGPELVVSIVAAAPPALVGPEVSSPLEAVRLERTSAGVELRVRVAPQVPYELRRELDRLVVLFGTAAPAATAPAPSAAALYRGLFPPSAGAGEPAGGQVADAERGTPAAVVVPPERPAEERAAGLTVGTLTLKPSATVSYVDADVSLLETAQPVRDRYGEARPALGVELPLRDGLLRLDYEARIRGYSAFDQVNGVTHQANAGLEYPTGPFITLRGHGHFARGLLETAEVDPGGEYFFRLGRFTRWQYAGGARFNPGGRLDVDLSGGVDRVTVDQDAGFFDYERRSAGGSVGMEVGPGRRASVVYGFEQVPAPPERPEVESKVHSISALVEGEILPLLNGRVTAGYSRRDSPRAAPAGQHFRGLTFGAQLKREFGRSANIRLSANRSTELSAFEQNAFYVTTSVQATLTAPLPLSFALTAGGGYHVNLYPTSARELGVPRRDRIVDWLAGLGRSLTRWAFVRADYRRDRRDSNLDMFDQDTHAFYLQVGFGFFGDTPRP